MKLKRKSTCTPVHERVLARTIIPKNKNDCWLWCGPVNNAGYGMIKGETGTDDPKMMTVHRAVARAHGLDIDNNEIQHTCLVKHCVNPQHLVEGVPQNRIDRMMKKYNGKWQKPKNPYKTCEHCGKTTYVVWFNRMHSDCYPGMNSLSRLIRV